jgi:Homeodomain-like domain
MAITRPARAEPSSRTGLVPAPPGYAPMAHPATPGRWDRRSIVDALRAWVAQMGAAPTRQDWSGGRADTAPPSQRKWMREHPRWPSSSCVAGHFGSWSKALAAAGLPARALTFDSSVVERVEAAWRLVADGHTIRATAETLGVSVSTVNNYLRATTCTQCGGPVPSPRATRCIACTAGEPTRPSAWTRQAVREAIRAWTEEHGEPPSYRDWTPSRSRPGRWEAESPRWPSAATVCELYRERDEAWNAALADAGVSVRFRRWGDDAVRSALAAFWTRVGRPPTEADLRRDDWKGPSSRTLRRRYGDLERAWQTLGPVPAGTTAG